MMTSSIRVRLPVSYALIALLTAGVLGAILLLSLENFYTLQERTYLETSASLMSPGIAKVLEAEEPPQRLHSYLQNLSFLIQARIRLLDPQDNVLADTGSLQSQPFIYTNLTPYGMGAEVLHEGRSDRYLFNVAINVIDSALLEPDSKENLVCLSPLPTENTLFGYGIGGTGIQSPQHTDQVTRIPIIGSTDQILGVLEVSEGLALGRSIIKNVARGWMIAGAVSVIVAGLAGWFVSRRLVDPLTDLTEVTHKMATGDLSARAKIETRDELELLGRSFNTMAAQVENIVSTLRRFIADAAHELHTPITTLGVNLELASEKDQNLPRYIANAQDQTARLQALVDSMLDLSRIEAGSQKRVRFSLSQLLKEVEEKFTNQAQQKGIAFDLELLSSSECNICGDLNQVHRAVENLVDNALKFTPDGGKVSLQLEKHEHSCHLIVQDSGIGILPEDMPELFQRFHRGRNATAYPGSGLGLAIVKAIMDQHEAQIQVASDSGGTRVTVTFPLDLRP